MSATAAQKQKADQLLAKMEWRKKTPDRYFRFQQGFGFAALTMDNDPGDLTITAMEYSLSKGAACTENFYWREFWCKHCGEVRVHRDLPRGLEVVKFQLMGGAPLVVKSGCRCDAHNRAVGGSTKSTHPTGGAADATLPTLKQVISLGIFSGMGATTGDEITRHVDVRGVDRTVPNHSGGSPKKPTLWPYNPRTFRFDGPTPKHWYRYPVTGPGLPPLLTWKIDGGKKKTGSARMQVPQMNDSRTKPAEPKPQPQPARSAAATDALVHQVRKAELILSEVKKELGI